MNDLIAEIKYKSCILKWPCEATDLELDAALGQIEALIYKARQSISDEWRAKKPATAIDLEELGL